MMRMAMVGGGLVRYGGGGGWLRWCWVELGVMAMRFVGEEAMAEEG